MKNQFGWMQLLSHDIAKAKSFYAKLFNWHITQAKDGEELYEEVDAGNGSCAGISKITGNEVPMWTPFVQVGNIKETLAHAQELGAKVLVDITAINEGESGYYAIFQGLDGEILGLHEHPTWKS